MNPSETAIVVVDVWNKPECPAVFQRLEAILPAMEDCLNLARDKDVTIIHAPTGAMHPYEGTPARDVIQTLRWVVLSEAPIVSYPESPWAKTGGCECNPERECKQDKRLWGLPLSQHPALTIMDSDFIIDADNNELLRVCSHRGIANLYYVGQALNMCIMGRNFGMGVMQKIGFNVSYSRDLTIVISGNGYDPDKKQLDESLTPLTAMVRVQEHMDKYVGKGLTSQEFLDKLW